MIGAELGALRREEYLEREVGGEAVCRRQVDRHLRSFQASWEVEHPGASFLGSLDSTEPVRAWLGSEAARSLAPATVEQRLRRLRGFTGWLFGRGRVDDDVPFYLVGREVARGGVPELRLGRNLQRDVAGFAEHLREAPPTVRTTWVRAAHGWNLYRNRAGAGLEGVPEMDEEELLGWLARLAVESPSACRARDLATGLERFLDFQVSEGRLAGHALGELLGRYRSRVEVVRALSGGPVLLPGEARRALARVERRAGFRSGLAEWLEALVEHRRSRGRWKDLRWSLGRLDRILERHGVERPEEIPAVALEEYLGEGSPAPRTRNDRLSVLRVLHRFLARRGARMLHPDAGWAALPLPPFRPHLFTLGEVGRVLEALRERGASSRHRLSWHGIETVVYLLYACGMRLSEPLKLRLGDVDLEERVVLVVDAKFYKQRWVPLGGGAVRRLADYRRRRDAAFPDRRGPGEPFFLNAGGRRLGPWSVQNPFREACRALGIRSRGTRGVRLHCLRHSFAVHRLYQWYSEGAEVQSKLPLLSVYMGHSHFHHTERYLHLAEDLLRQAGRSFQASFEQVVGRLVDGDAAPS